LHFTAGKSCCHSQQTVTGGEDDAESSAAVDPDFPALDWLLVEEIDLGKNVKLPRKNACQREVLRYHNNR
jgi:hypothetical protein